MRPMSEAYSPGDPMRSAQKNMRPEGLKRFYAEVGVGEVVEAGRTRFPLLLDGRPARTPAKSKFAFPSRALAEEVAAEWAAQGTMLDPAAMPLTRIANSALDGVAGAMSETRAEIVGYAGSDMLCYRAREPEALRALQAAAFDPPLAWADRALGARFVIAEGLMHLRQPEPALTAIAAAIARFGEPLEVAALHVMTTLTGSVLLALAVAHGALRADEAWRIAHVDEDFQISQWGEDDDANARRAARWREMAAAARVIEALRK
jgi:chaperone required for assembly of F1-ATPase